MLYVVWFPRPLHGVCRRIECPQQVGATVHLLLFDSTTYSMKSVQGLKKGQQRKREPLGCLRHPILCWPFFNPWTVGVPAIIISWTEIPDQQQTLFAIYYRRCWVWDLCSWNNYCVSFIKSSFISNSVVWTIALLVMSYDITNNASFHYAIRYERRRNIRIPGVKS